MVTREQHLDQTMFQRSKNHYYLCLVCESKVETFVAFVAGGREIDLLLFRGHGRPCLLTTSAGLSAWH